MLLESENRREESQTRQFYKVFKPFLDSKAQSIDDNAIILENNDNDIRDQTMVSNCFVEYFTDIAQGIGDPNLLDLSEEQLYEGKRVQQIRSNKRIVNGSDFSFSKVSETDVKCALGSLKVNKRCDHDGLPNKILKLTSQALAKRLTRLFNTCIEENYWPTEWKKGEWVPVYNKDNPTDVRNYCTVSAVGKVIEQLLAKQLTTFMELHLNNNLTAYFKKNSCKTSLVKLVEEWKMSLDSRNIVGILSTDLSKAFDSLHLPVLLTKLRAYDLSKDAIDMLRCYFAERKNRVRMRSGVLSEWPITLEHISKRSCS